MKHSKKVSFSIAEPYVSEEGYWTYKGVHAWCAAKIYSYSKKLKLFAEAVKKNESEKVSVEIGTKGASAAHQL